MHPTLFTTPGVRRFAEDVDRERQAQLAKFGDQHHPDGTCLRGDDVRASNARTRCQTLAAGGKLTWRAILDEEVAEAYAESDSAALRDELVQVGAVCAAWIYDLDRRGDRPADGEQRDQAIAPEPYRYVDEDQFCLSARLLPDLNTGGRADTLSITVEGDSDPQGAHVPVAGVLAVVDGILRAAGLPTVAEREVAAVRRALEDARKLHERCPGTSCGTCADEDGQAARWPCETWNALNAAVASLAVASPAREQRPCGEAFRGHGPHKYMLGRLVHQCPGGPERSREKRRPCWYDSASCPDPCARECPPKELDDAIPAREQGDPRAAIRAQAFRDAAHDIATSDELRDFTDDHMSDMNEAASFLRRRAAQIEKGTDQ